MKITPKKLKNIDALEGNGRFYYHDEDYGECALHEIDFKVFRQSLDYDPEPDPIIGTIVCVSRGITPDEALRSLERIIERIKQHRTTEGYWKS